MICLVLLVACPWPLLAPTAVSAVGSFAESRLVGWSAEGQAWGLTTRPRAGAPAGHHAESLAGGEQATGILRSEPFAITGNLLRLLVNGWDGRYGGQGRNRFLLRRVSDGAILRTATPPCSDDFSPVAWLVGDLAGERVCVEAVDGDTAGAFAWLGLARVEQAAYAAARLRPLRLQAVSTWGVLERDGARRRVAPYLSSLVGGEPGTGIVRSPDFTVASDTIRFQLCGHDGEGGGRHANFAALRDLDAGALLRQTWAPGSDDPVACTWQVADLRGRRVAFEMHDGLAGEGYSWLGVNHVDAGPALQLVCQGSGLPPGWQAVSPGNEVYVTACGVPFLALAAGRTAVPEGGQARLECGFAARSIYLLGMINTWDHGNPVWGWPGDYSDRLFIGDRIGDVVIEYADGSQDTIPLRLGWTAWWYEDYTGMGATEPFASDPAARAVLERALALYPTGQAGTHAYLLALRPQGQPIRALRLVDNPGRRGAPAIAGITVDSDTAGLAAPAPAATAAERQWLGQHTVTTHALPSGVEQHLQALRRVLYSSAADLQRPLPVSIPAGFRGPRLRFWGPPAADVITNLYYHSLHDMNNKVDPDGTFHTSTRGAPSWGGYQGFGTWQRQHGAYYDHAWSRDLGRVLQEMAELGYQADAQACADWCNHWLRWFPRQFPRLRLGGGPLPGHWVRIINHPEWTQTPGMPAGFGNLENDGHGLIMLFQYRTWLHAGRQAGYVLARWESVREAAEYLCWLLEHPETSRAHDGVLFSDSEGGGMQASIYCDLPCSLGLRAYAQMAQAAGKAAEAARWRSYADRLQGAIGRYYAKEEGWDAGKAAVWPFGHSVLAPAIMWPDLCGLDLTGMPAGWEARCRRTLERQLARCRPDHGSAVAMGYGQCFLTQAALLLDEMAHASGCVERLAQFTYYPRFAPYIVPEGCEVDRSGRWWHRTGDLGNAVQEGEAIKCVRIMLGIDDSDPARTRFLPRLPLGWRGMEVQGYPVVTLAGGRVVSRLVSCSWRRERGRDSMSISSSGRLAGLAVRLGPYPRSTRRIEAWVNGRRQMLAAQPRGDAAWGWLAVPRGASRISIRARSR